MAKTRWLILATMALAIGASACEDASDTADDEGLVYHFDMVEGPDFINEEPAFEPRINPHIGDFGPYLDWAAMCFQIPDAPRQDECLNDALSTYRESRARWADWETE